MNQINTVVYLVGAGPGDPGLITVAGADVLQKADVVVYDYLANTDLLRLCRRGAELIYVGKSGIQHTKTQDQINQLLVEKSRQVSPEDSELKKDQERIIVRLKGGDPYVFGRGGEEAEFLHAAGIPFVIIPGITAGIAAPAYAGIPVTHRDFASTITFITGHEKENPESSDDPRINYEALVKLDGTLVFYMGVKSLPLITQRLIAAGLDANTPAAAIRWGTRPHQQTVIGTVATIANLVQKAGLKAPAITIIGKVVTLRQNLNWFEKQPLFGQRMIVTRTRQQASDLSLRLQELGAQVIEAPTIDLLPPTDAEWEAIDRTLQHIPIYDWVVFTSPNGVRATWDRLRFLTFDSRHFGASHIAAIGKATADALAAFGIVADVMPEKFIGEELAAAIQQAIGEDEELRGKRFLLLRADIARPILRETLEKSGGIVEDIAIYHTIKPSALPEEVTAALAEAATTPIALSGWITFTSASTATNLWQLLTPVQRQTIARMNRASIGPITSAALAALGNGEWKATIEAKRHDIPGLVEAVLAAASHLA